MAYSWQEETYAAGTQSITVDIEYLDKSYIHLYLNGVETTDFSWTSDVLISLSTALTDSTLVTIVRRTDKEFLYIKFADGAAFVRENLDTQNTQFLHLAQELVEGRSIDGFYGDLSMNGYRVTNLGTPVNSTDAVTKAYADNLLADETAARVSADQSLQAQITGDTPVLSAERAVVSWHGQTIENSVAIPDGVNAVSIGPQITIAPGQAVTVGAGSHWSILGNVYESDDLYNITANNLITEGGDTTVAVDEIVVDSDLGTMASQNSTDVSITGGSITGIVDLSIADGGTGASTAAAARTNLGLGNLATQSASTVDITGGSVTGITDLAVADGGTGASTASAARANLGAAESGANSSITSLSGLTTPLSIEQGGTGQNSVTYLRAESPTGGTSLTTGVFTQLTPTEVLDTANAYAAGVWTVPSTGYYQICGFVRFAIGAGTQYTKGMLAFAPSASTPTAYVDGATVGDYNYASSGLGEIILNLSCVQYLTAGVSYALYMFQNSGGSLNTSKEGLQIIRVA